jgi:hypothetical protein
VVRKHAVNAWQHDLGAFHVSATSTPESRGYKERKKKGKPIDKRPVQRHLIKNSDLKIAVTGPDFIGCTTLL